MLYLVMAYDGDDEAAPARRAAVRPAHLEEARHRSEAGGMPFAGALLSDAGAMVGSALVIEADDEAAARAIIEEDIYTTSGVWVRYDIWPIKRAF